jgi:hypothetical protein
MTETLSVQRIFSASGAETLKNRLSRPCGAERTSLFWKYAENWPSQQGLFFYPSDKKISVLIE